MKRVISAAIFLAILSTPALANKTQIQTCNDRKLEMQIIYHLDKIEMLLDEMRKNALSVPSKPKDTDKKSG
jgi:hypothetical protein